MNKIKLISLLAAAAVMTGSVAMAETYSATGNGYHGEMTVNVTIEDGKITDVELGDNHETNVVIDRAFPVIRERILEANTADVDSVSAATFSSYAIKTAVADAMQQAGLEAPKVAMQNAEKTATERAAESCDIVIVGGGPAGLAAAVSAKQTNADKNVILVEKLDILSGNGKFDMNFFDMINTEAQKAAGNDEWVGEAGLAKFLEEKSSNGESAERIQVWANEEYNLDAWLRAMGVELNYNYGGTNHMAEDNQYSGEVIQAGLEKAAAELGVDVRTGTKGVDLVMEDGVEPVDIQEIITLRAYITNLHTMPAGESIGYPQKFRSGTDLQLATLSVGFADGIPVDYARGQGPILVHGRRTRFLELCMDQSIIDVTGIPCKVGDEVTLIGQDGDERISVYSIEKRTGRTFDALLTFISDRIARICR